MRNTSSLEKRLAALEQRHTNIQTMRVLHPGAHEHHGLFIVKAGERTYTEQRKPDEVWNDFARRMDQHATGVLKLLQFVPVDEAGNQLYMNEPEGEYLQ